MDTIALPARGGPLDGQPLESRFPTGVLLVHKPSGRCWLYDLAADSATWILRIDAESDADGVRAWDRERSRTAADGIEYDVRALDVAE